MEFVYMIVTFILVMLSVFMLHKKSEMKVAQKKVKSKYKEIENINKQLDDIAVKLNSVTLPLTKINDISSKILSYRK